MFYGEFAHSLDRKGRLIIPSKFREAIKEAYAEKLYITQAKCCTSSKRVENKNISDHMLGLFGGIQHGVTIYEQTK